MRTLRVFVSSPGDVAEERAIAVRVLERLDAQYRGRTHLEPVLWEHEPLVATASFQEQLIRPSDTDVVVCILWSRLGTRLPPNVTRPDGSRYDSGTQFEFEDAVNGFRARGSPDLLVYRKTSEPMATLLDRKVVLERLDQKEALDRFIDHWFHSSGDGSLTAAFHPFATTIEFEQLLERHLHKLIERKLPREERPADIAPEWIGSSPYRGLERFDFGDAGNFFGRTQAVSDMIAALRAQAAASRAFLLVLGSSGAGKSSVVRAGLAPMLMERGVIVGVQCWRRAVFTPADASTDLFRGLVAALEQPDALPELARTAGSREIVVRAMRESPAVAADMIARATAAFDRPGEARLLVILDQLEEIFSNTQVGDADRRGLFELLRAVAATGRVWVVATLRSDFYEEAMQFEALAELKANGGQYDLRSPTAVEISQIIRDPVRKAGLRFEVDAATGESLDDRLRDAALAEPDVLPLLQFVLQQLFERRSPDGTLTFRAYDDLGGLAGALARRAEEVLTSLPEASQAEFPRMLRQLVSLGTADQDVAVRRRARLDLFDQPGVRELASALVAARLLTARLSDAGHPTVEIAHEALLAHWPRVASWIEQNRESLRVRARVAAAARRWEQEGRTDDFLASSGKPFYEVRSLLEEAVELDPSELAFARACDARHRRMRRVRTAAFAGVSVLAALTTASAIIAYQQRAEALAESRIADATASFMVDLFRVADPSESRGNRITVREILDRGASRIAQSLADQPEVRSSLMSSIGEAYGGLGLYEPAIALLTQALADAERPDASAPEDVVRVRNALARVLYLDAKYERAAELFGTSLAEARRLRGGDHPDVSASLVGLGDALISLERAGEAEAHYRAALEMDRRLHGAVHADVARSANALATAHYFSGAYEQAEPLFAEALRIHRQVYGNQHPAVAESLNNLGSLRFQLGDYPAAARIWREALPVFRAVFGAEHPEVASILNNLGRTLLLNGELDEAGRLLEQALAIDRKLMSSDHDERVPPLNSLAMVRMGQGRLAEAGLALDEAEAIGRASQHWLLQQVLMNKADLLVRLGQPVEARPLLDESRASLAAEYPLEEMPQERWRHALLDSIEAELRASQGEGAAAEALLLSSLDVVRARFGERGLYTRDVLRRLAHLYERAGRAEQARRYRAQLAQASRGDAAAVQSSNR